MALVKQTMQLYLHTHTHPRINTRKGCQATLPPVSRLLLLHTSPAHCSLTTSNPPPTSKTYRSDTKMAERKAVIKNADMSEDMQQDAVDCASQALEKYNIEKDIAAFIKKEFDKK